MGLDHLEKFEVDILMFKWFLILEHVVKNWTIETFEPLVLELIKWNLTNTIKMLIVRLVHVPYNIGLRVCLNVRNLMWIKESVHLRAGKTPSLEWDNTKRLSHKKQL